MYNSNLSMWNTHLRVGGAIIAAINPESTTNRFSAAGSLFPQKSPGGQGAEKKGKRANQS